MADWAAMAEGFRYDAWANRLWLACLNEKGPDNADLKILGHVLSAQKVWLTRCQGVSLSKFPELEVSQETIMELKDGWLQVLSEAKEDRVISYSRINGEAMSSPVSEIVNQVLNHGTYHRGELRGLCLARGDESFPETDRILYWNLMRS